MRAANLAPTEFSSSSPSSQPPILSITAMAHENSAFRLDYIAQIELILHEKRPDLFHDVFSRRLGPPFLFGMWPNSSCFLVREAFLFFPFLCTDGGTLYTCPPINGPGSKSQNIRSSFVTEKPKLRARMPPSVTRARRRPRGRRHAAERRQSRFH